MTGDANACPKSTHMPRRRVSLIRHGMMIAAIEGIVVAAMIGFIESFLVPLLQVGLSATPSQIGLLTIIPLLGTTLIGLKLSPVIRWLGGNKRTVLIHALVQAACLVLLSIPLHAVNEAWSVPVALCLGITIGLAGAIGGPAWTSWMGGLVPRRLQSRYLAFRSRLVIVVKLGFAAVFAGILHYLPAEVGPWGLQVLLIIASVSRALSAWLIHRQHEPTHRRQPSELALEPRSHGGFVHFIRSSTRTDFGRWTLVWATLHFGVMLAGPYFAVYMLTPTPRGLGLDPALQYVLLVQTSVVVRMLSYPLVGRLVDLYGPAAMLRVAVCGIVIFPLGWAFCTSFPLLITIECLSGLCWCTAEIAVGVLLFGCHPDPLVRSRMIGYHQTVVTAFATAGAVVGGLLLARDSDDPEHAWLPVINESAFHTIFLISACFRLPAALLALRFLPSLRRLTSEETKGLWRLVPGTGLVQTLSRGLMGHFRRPEG